MIRLLDQLWDRNMVPIFLSTDAVFDGSQGGNTEEGECYPLTVYGRQKLEAENYLRASENPYTSTGYALLAESTVEWLEN